MSSFIIDKREYVRCAGMMHGILDQFSEASASFKLELYDSMVDVYMCNVKSFNLQYDTNEEPEEDEYRDEYDMYRKIGFGLDVKETRKMFFNIIKFFRSADYQIEDDECSMEAESIFWDCTSVLVSNIFRSMGNDITWGEFDIMKEEKE